MLHAWYHIHRDLFEGTDRPAHSLHGTLVPARFRLIGALQDLIPDCNEKRALHKLKAQPGDVVSLQTQHALCLPDPDVATMSRKAPWFSVFRFAGYAPLPW